MSSTGALALTWLAHRDDVTALITGPSRSAPYVVGISPTATLAQWSRFGDLDQIDVPTLVIGATHDTMDPAHMKEVARRLPHGTYLHCPEGSHMAMYDDQETYFRGLIDWLDGLR